MPIPRIWRKKNINDLARKAQNNGIGIGIVIISHSHSLCVGFAVFETSLFCVLVLFRSDVVNPPLPSVARRGGGLSILALAGARMATMLMFVMFITLV